MGGGAEALPGLHQAHRAEVERRGIGCVPGVPAASRRRRQLAITAGCSPQQQTFVGPRADQSKRRKERSRLRRQQRHRFQPLSELRRVTVASAQRQRRAPLQSSEQRSKMPLNRVSVLVGTVFLLLLASGAAAAGPSASSSTWTCPPPGFASVASFSLQDYIARPWFVQQQQENSYQRRDQLFCVRAEYRLASNTSQGRLKVFNQVRSLSTPFRAGDFTCHLTHS